MQVFGLPGHLIRSARSASRLLAAKTPISKRREDGTPWRDGSWRARRTDGRAGRAGGRRVALHPRSLAQARRAAQPTPPSLRRPEPSRRRWRRRSSASGSTFRCGARLNRSARAELGFAVSDATVGRILSELIKRGRVPAVSALLRKIGPRSAAKKRPYAVRKPKDVAFEKPGDVVQIDTLSIAILPGRTIKQFTAYDPFAKWTVAKPYQRATAKNAAEFLERVRAQMPDPVRAVQIDGGSEFMAEFEQACAEATIPLYVLPPRSPKLNGAVERCNGAWRYEFYACSDLPLDIDKIAKRVDAFQHLYNNHRPHGALAGMTRQSTSQSAAPETPPSHMS